MLNQFSVTKLIYTKKKMVEYDIAFLIGCNSQLKMCYILPFNLLQQSFLSVHKFRFSQSKMKVESIKNCFAKNFSDREREY